MSPPNPSKDLRALFLVIAALLVIMIAIFGVLLYFELFGNAVESGDLRVRKEAMDDIPSEPSR